jgi:tetratricopeptide (TPR) repeat protein
MKDYAKAIEDCTTALEIDPENINAYGSRGETYFDMGGYDSAIADFNAILSMDPDNGEAKEWLEKAQAKAASFCTKCGNAIAAGAAFCGKCGSPVNSANSAKPKVPGLDLSAETYYERACNGIGYGDIPGALGNLTRAIILKPGFVEAYLKRGSVYMEDGRFDEAIEDFNRVLRIHPGNPEAAASLEKAKQKKAGQ